MLRHKESLSGDSMRKASVMSWGWRLLEDFMRDFRFGLRDIIRRPLFSILAILIMSFGLSINIAMFSIINTLLFQPIPVADAESLYELSGTSELGQGVSSYSYRDYTSIRDANQVFDGLIADCSLRASTKDGKLVGFLVSENYFATLGVGSVMGRMIMPGDEQPVEPIVLLSYSAWRSRFDSDPQILGKVIEIAGSRFVVIGVTSPEFKGIDTDSADFWTPLSARPLLVGKSLLSSDPADLWLRVIGRVKKGIKPEPARASLVILQSQLSETRPKELRIMHTRLTSHAHYMVWGSNNWINASPIVGTFGLVLLIACSNLATLQLVRSMGRQREIGIRISLGGKRIRIVRQLATESVPVLIAGGVVGFGLSKLGLETIRRIIPAEFADSPVFDFRIDARVMLFSVVIWCFVFAVIGLIPALQATRVDVSSTLKSGRGSFLAGRRGLWLQSTLVVGQFSLTMALLVLTGAVARAAARLESPGFDTAAGVCVFAMSGIPRALLADRLAEQLGALSVAAQRIEPLHNRMNPIVVTSDSQGNSRSFLTAWNAVSSEYFNVLGVPIIQGRGFSLQDEGSRSDVALVSEATARRFWPDENPIGKVLRVERATSQSHEVIGVVGNINNLVDDKENNFVYFNLPVHNSSGRFILRVAGDPAEMVRRIQSDLIAAYPKAEFEVYTLADWMRQGRIQYILASKIGFGLSMLGLLLGSAGIYGVVSYLVGKRTYEIGIRMALGAQRWNVLWIVMRDGSRLMIVSVLFGQVFALALSRLLARSGMFRVDAVDPVLFTFVTIVLASIGFLATFLPARRASLLNPSVALRDE
jgi:putative ABC transport system permease protein